MRLHLLALPHTRLDEDHLSCAYTQKVVKFLNMMAGLHEIYLYGPEIIPLANGHTDHIVCVQESERAAWFGAQPFNTVNSGAFNWDGRSAWWQKFAERAIPAIKERAQQGDIVLVTSGGDTQMMIANAVADRCKIVEWAVGYEGVVADFCAFESYAWMHHVYGLRQWRNGRVFDQVIPNYFDEADFLPPREPDSKPYLLFLGRVLARKGPHIAAQIAARLGMKLVVAGPGAIQAGTGGRIYGEGVVLEDGELEYVGEVGKAQRAELIAGAACMLSPTVYVEPFGGSAVEAMMGGCPVVGSDWGAFTETVTKETGRTFRTMRQACMAVIEAMTLDRNEVARVARAKYSLDAVRPRFERWFEQIQTLWGPGYYAK
jgi:glycosyltransferase involved in cell wall biosynthesis